MASNQNEQSVHQAQMSRICPIVMAHASSEAEGEKQLQRITYTKLRVNGGCNSVSYPVRNDLHSTRVIARRGHLRSVSI